MMPDNKVAICLFLFFYNTKKNNAKNLNIFIFYLLTVIVFISINVIEKWFKYTLILFYLNAQKHVQCKKKYGHPQSAKEKYIVQWIVLIKAQFKCLLRVANKVFTKYKVHFTIYSSIYI